MNSIKLSPLLLFILILLLLVLSSVISSRYLNVEGFVGFQNTAKPLDEVSIDSYSTKNKVVKMYDNLYFDMINGNVIQIEGPEMIGSEGFVNRTASAAASKAASDKAASDKAASDKAASDKAASAAAAAASDKAASDKAAATKAASDAANKAASDAANKAASDAATKAASDKAASDAAAKAASDAATAAATATAAAAAKTASDAAAAAKATSDAAAAAAANSITKINIISRAGVMKSGIGASKDTPESLISTMAKSYTSWHYVTQPDSAANQYQLFYIPWADKTFIHIIDIKSTPNVHVSTFSFGPGTKKEYNEYKNKRGARIQPRAPSTDDADMTANINKYIDNPLYTSSSKLYLFDSMNDNQYYYDDKNGNLLIKNKFQQAYSIMERGFCDTNQPAPVFKVGEQNISKIVNPGFTSISTFLPCLSENVLYIPFDKNTLIASIASDALNSGQYKLSNVKRFGPDGIDSGSVVPSPSVPSPSVPATNIPTVPPTSDGSSDYWKWFWYWNTNGGDNKSMSNDYILKTQIVPPVCPTCPTCPSCSSDSGVCTDCGGQGGSGTQGGYGGNTRPGSSSFQPSFNVPDNVTGNATGNTIGNTVIGTVDAAGNVINRTVGTAGELAYATGSGATNLIKSAGSGVGEVLREAGGLAYAAGSGATNLLRSAGTGATNLLGNANNNYGGYGGYGSGGYGGSGYGSGSNYSGNGGNQGYIGKGSGAPGIDQYSYYGALPSKGGNYMPMTASFSAFGK
jgi:hypothetical protein